MDCVIDPAPASGVPSRDLSAAPGDWFSHKFVNVGTRDRSLNGLPVTGMVRSVMEVKSSNPMRWTITVVSKAGHGGLVPEFSSGEDRLVGLG
jgi:hypothetical protein